MTGIVGANGNVVGNAPDAIFGALAWPPILSDSLHSKRVRVEVYERLNHIS